MGLLNTIGNFVNNVYNDIKNSDVVQNIANSLDENRKKVNAIRNGDTQVENLNPQYQGYINTRNQFQEQRAKQTETLLNGGTTKDFLGKEHKLTDEDYNKIGGVLVDRETGKEVDYNYYNDLYNNVSNNLNNINSQMESLNNDYKYGKIDQASYVNKATELQGAWDENIEKSKELDKVEFKDGKAYYDWIKENGTKEEIGNFENFVTSFDDTWIESLANATYSSWVNTLNFPAKAIDLAMATLTAEADNPYDIQNGFGKRANDVANEISRYTMNGDNSKGFAKYSLQTISSLMPMINDVIIGVVTGLPVGKFTNIEMGTTSAYETTTQRLQQGVDYDKAVLNGLAHGITTGIVEGFNMGDIGLVSSFLTGAGGDIVGAGMLSLMNGKGLLRQTLGSAFGEAKEEVFEYGIDWILDSLMGVETDASPFTKEAWQGDDGLVAQMLMAGAGAILLGIPTGTKAFINSKIKFNTAEEAKSLVTKFSQYYQSIGNTEMVKQYKGIYDWLTQEQQTYANNSKAGAMVTLQSDVVTPKFTVDAILNTKANAWQNDVADQVGATQTELKAIGNITEMLQDEINKRGGNFSAETYVQAPQEVRQFMIEAQNDARALGQEIIYDNKQDSNHITGTNVNYINPNQTLNEVIEDFGHEMFGHALEGVEGYEDIKTLASENEKMSREKIKKEYDEAGVPYNLENEYVAKNVGQNINKDNIDQIVKYNTSFATRMLETFKKFANKSTYAKNMANVIQESVYKLNNENKSIVNNIFNKVGNIDLTTVTDVDEEGNGIIDGALQLNYKTFKNGGKEKLFDWLTKSETENGFGMGTTDAQNIIDYLDELADMMESLGDKNAPRTRNWNKFDLVEAQEITLKDGTKLRGAIVNNGDYKYNLDFSLKCVKRENLDSLLGMMIQKGWFNNLIKTDVKGIAPNLQDNVLLYEEINKVIKEHGFDISCGLCFVESKRYNEPAFAKRFADAYNTIVESMAAKKYDIDEFNYTKRKSSYNDNVNKKNLLSNQTKVNMKYINDIIKTYENRKNIDATKIPEKLTLKYRIAMAIKDNPSMWHKVNPSEFLSSLGNDAIANKNPELMKLWRGYGGVAKPKITYSNVAYNNDIIKQYLSKTKANREKMKQEIKDVGGYRLQSFSDYIPQLFLDYAQALTDLSSIGLPAHSYTKVRDYVKLFGLTGMKINESLVGRASYIDKKTLKKMPKEDVDFYRSHAGLEIFTSNDYQTFDSNDFAQIGNVLKEHYFPEETISNLEKSFNKHQGELYWDNGTQKPIETFADYLKANNGLQEYATDQYEKDWLFSKGKDSLQHYAMYLFEDESFNYKAAIDIQNQLDYSKNVGTISIGLSDYQIRMMLADPNIKMVIPYHKSGLNAKIRDLRNIGMYKDFTKMQNTTKSGSKVDDDFLYNKVLNELTEKYKGTDKFNDVPRLAANEYLKQCKKNKTTPKFNTFANDVNYYKLLTDFSLYDSEGNYSPQLNVTMDANHMPSDVEDIVKGNINERRGIAFNESERKRFDAESNQILNEVAQRLGLERQYNLKANRMFADQELEDKLNNFDTDYRTRVNPNKTPVEIPKQEQQISLNEFANMKNANSRSDLYTLNNYGTQMWEQAKKNLDDKLNFENLEKTYKEDAYQQYRAANEKPLTPQEASTLEDLALEEARANNLTSVKGNKAKVEKPTNTKETINKLRKHWVNLGFAIWDKARESKNTKLYPLYDMYRSSNAMATNMLNKVGGWEDIINSIPQELQGDFGTMMYHWLDSDIEDRTKSVFQTYDKGAKRKVASFTQEQDLKIVQEYLDKHPEWQGVAQKVWDYEKELRQVLLESGRITQETVDQWDKMYPHYVHIVRDIKEQPIVDDGTINNVVSSNKNTVKSREGGINDLRSLHDAIEEQTFQVYRASNLNKFAKEYDKVINRKSESFADLFDTEIRKVINGIGQEIKSATTDTEPQLIYYDDGDMRVINISQDVYDALVPSEKPDTKLTRGIKQVNNWRRNLITGMNPLFAIRNIIKDTQDIAFKSAHPLLTYSQLLKPTTWYELIKNTEDAQLWHSLGGGVQNITELHTKNKAYNYTIGLIEKLNNFIESVPRYAEFKASLLEGKTKEQAMYDSNRVTTNFKMGGDYTKVADSFGFTFLNASMEGFNELVQDYELAYDENGLKGITTKMAMSVLISGIPLAILNHLRWKDDKDYEELSDYIKDDYYIIAKRDGKIFGIPTGLEKNDGKFIRIPKGRIANAYQRIITGLTTDNIKTLKSDDKAVEKAVGMWKNVLDGIIGAWGQVGVNNPLQNNILSPIFDVANNRTWYGEELLSDNELKKAPSEQYDYTTDALSKGIGQALNVSPKKINYLLDQYGGVVGDVLLPMGTPKAEQDTDNPLVAPIMNDFVTDPVFKNQNVSDFFDTEEKLKQKASKENATDEEKIQQKYMSSMKDKILELYGDRKEIFNDTTLSDSEKYNKAREVQRQIDDLAKQSLDTYKSQSVSGNYSNVGGIEYYKDSSGGWTKVTEDTQEKLSGLTDEQKSDYFAINDLISQAKKDTDKFTKNDVVDAIDSYDNVDAKNDAFDIKYANTKVVQYVNDMGLSPEDTWTIKMALSQQTTNKKGNTITDKYKAAQMIADAGLQDEVMEYLEENDLSPSDIGLSNKAISTYWGVSSGTSNASKKKALINAIRNASSGTSSNVLSGVNKNLTDRSSKFDELYKSYRKGV